MSRAKNLSGTSPSAPSTGLSVFFPRAPRALWPLCLALCVSGCSVFPVPLGGEEREAAAARIQVELFQDQEPLAGPLTLAEAAARAIKYQAENRQRQMEQAAAEAQLEVAKFDLLPKLTANAGYTTRDNDSFGFGISPSGQIGASPSASQERTRSTYSLGFSWNVLDFGVSYYRARQLADQSLIADERRRKALQTLMHDVRVAWWRAEAAQRLLPLADAMLAEIDRVSEKTRVIEARKLLPPQQTATLRRALLDLSQQISMRRQELAQSRVELAALINVPPGTDVRVATSRSEAREVLDLTADVEKLEALALRARPEIAEEAYRARISADEARRALAALLPSLTFDVASNYDSNRFLVNNAWTSAGVAVALNLVKLFSLPALKRAEQAQEKADSARRLAMAMAVLAQTRIAAVRYQLVADEFLIWEEAVRDDDLIAGYLAYGAEVGIDTEIELIRARARALASRMNRDLSYALLQASLARVHHSVGYDAVPQPEEGRAVSDLARLLQARLAELDKVGFSAAPPPRGQAVAIGEIKVVPEHGARLMHEGAMRVLAASKVRMVTADLAEVRLNIEGALESPAEGKRAARISVRLQRSGAAQEDGAVQFTTTLSEPVDDEQWRALGEGAAYRVLDRLWQLRVRRPSLRSALVDPLPSFQPAAGAEALPSASGEPLALHLEHVLRVREGESGSALGRSAD